MCSLFYSARALFLLLLSALSRDFSVFLCVFTIFLCVFTISVRSWLSALSRDWARCPRHHFLHVFLQDDTCISPRWYLYFPKMIHVFLQDDITIACTISVESCLPWAVIELAVRPTCSQNLEDVEVTLQFFFTARVYLLFYATMQICTTLHNVLLHLSLYLHTLQQIANNTSRIVLSDLFSRNEDWKNQIGCNSPCTMHHLHHAPGAWCIVLPMLSRVLAPVSISTRKLASSNKICWALCIL